MAFRNNSNSRTSIGPQADRPELPNAQRVDGLFYVSEVALSAWDSQANVWRQFGIALPPGGPFPPAGNNPGGTIVVGLITYISVQTAPGVYNWVATSGVVPPPTGALDFAEFYSLMPGDNTATIATNAPLLFENIGAAHAATGIQSIHPVGPGRGDQFRLVAPGIYYVMWQVSVDEGLPGNGAQMALRLNGAKIASSVVGRATGTNKIVGISLVDTLTVPLPNSVLEVINDIGSGVALTITPIAGGPHPVSCSLVVKRYL